MRPGGAAAQYFSRAIALAVALALASGCAYTSPYVGQGPHHQITRGKPIWPIDALGEFFSLPFKLILWNWRFNRHSVSEATEAKLIQFLDARNEPAFEETIYRINQYSPIADLRSLIKNRHVAWPYRLTLGLLTTLVSDVLLPGRIFPSGDYYNPFTNTAHLYSDDAPIAMHEAGHAYDFAQFSYKGTYAALRIVPFIDLYQEWRATDEALTYLIESGDRATELRAYKVLWPAYGTYVGAYLPIPFGNIPGAVVGHIVGRSKAAARKRYYEHYDALLRVKPPVSDSGSEAPDASSEPAAIPASP